MLKYGEIYKKPISFYYGYEILLNQVVPMPRFYPHSDLLPRRTMVWDLDQDRTEFFSFISDLIKQSGRTRDIQLDDKGNKNG